MRLIANTLASQVEGLLRGRIREGVYAPGSRIPSETELSEELGVSRATVRTVLAKLAVNGLILRKQGDGTYINARVEKISAHLGNVWDFFCLIESNGFSCGAVDNGTGRQVIVSRDCGTGWRISHNSAP